jgi:peptide/histidine transporter 3/4
LFVKILGYCVYIAQAEETRTDIHAESVNLTGDGSLDRHGQIADKRKTGGWRAAPLIFGTEICERMATLGLQRNLVTYFTTEIHMSNPQAANMVSNFVGTLYLTPFIGGFAADAYLGRFWAIAVFATIQVVEICYCGRKAYYLWRFSIHPICW